jgi:iron(II)-dependent oxidoreductase
MDEKPALNCGKWKGGTSPVCSRPKGNSEQGVCDLMGNVYEWTGDWFYPSYDKKKFKEVPKMLNGSTQEWSYHRVLRGGGLGSDGGKTAKQRVLHDPPFAYVGLGIRCVR